ncbi:MAG: ABC transporter ATP-binding protein [Clostridiales bacterium]|jgi:ABC-2 type transport system ATP-binding protein|nr:ABC transporter ATP-binding protein [Clostridiales bacterium]
MNTIIVSDIKKSFKVFFDKSPTLKEKMIFRNRNRHENREVLRGVSFTVENGEAVGLIGENGSGKSTLLKLLSRIMFPDDGEIIMHGRVSSLIELGAGFHPDLSGRENIYTNASIFGLKKDEIDSRLRTIIDFSELGEFIDNPVRTYSSGMYMRLAFSVAINVDADILLIDEILSVGDASFQSKCFDKLREIKKNGTTIIIVSHSLGQIEQFCDRSIWLEQGVIRLEGKPYEVHPFYIDFMNEKRQEHIALDGSAPIEIVEQKPQSVDNKRWGNKAVEIVDVSLHKEDGREADSFATGAYMEIRIKYRLNDEKVKTPEVGIAIFRNDGLICYGTNTNVERVKDYVLKSEGQISFYIDNMSLLQGEYLIDTAFHDENEFPYDYWREAISFKVFTAVNDIGTSRLSHKWEFN